MSSPLRLRFYLNQGNPSLLNLISVLPRRVLDLGCGAGDNARLLSAGGATVDGITLSPAEARRAGRFCRRMWVWDLEAGLPRDLRPEYDAVICSHVLEHLRQPERLVGDLARLLAKSGGILYVALPNPFYYKNRWRLALGSCRYEPSGIMDSTHLRWFTFATGREMLEGGGFRILQKGVEASLPLAGLRRVLPQRIIAGLDRIGGTLCPGLFGYQLLYSAQVGQPSH